MAWSNNAENIYSFRINRVEPLNIFLLSKLLGPVRYDFFTEASRAIRQPNSPWVHSEMFSFRPTKNFEFGFQTDDHLRRQGSCAGDAAHLPQWIL